MVDRRRKEYKHRIIVVALKPIPMSVKTAGMRGGSSSFVLLAIVRSSVDVLLLLLLFKGFPNPVFDEELWVVRIVTLFVGIPDGIRLKFVGEGGGGFGDGIPNTQCCAAERFRTFENCVCVHFTTLNHGSGYKWDKNAVAQVAREAVDEPLASLSL